MRRKLVVVELVYFDHYDKHDKVNVEERYIIGYFFSAKELERAIKLCEEQKKPGGEIKLTVYNFKCTPEQSYVYVLSYQYTIVNENGEREYVYENFGPQCFYYKCIIQKEKLLKRRKYRDTRNRIFEDTKDGFKIRQRIVDFIYRIDY